MTYTKDNIIFAEHLTDPRFKNLTNQVFGRLTVLGYAGMFERYSRWFCECECGTIKAVVTAKLINGNTVSCGCRKRLGLSFTHGESRGGKVSTEYLAYHEAKKRCTYPKLKCFKDYGGRGIEFRFTSFNSFLEHIGRKPSPEHSLDRIDVNGHYEAGNVRWAIKTVQARNTRTNRIITLDGVSHCVEEWAEITGIKKIRLRLFRGWCERCAVTLPLRGRCPHKNKVN